jgi:hypothetical protein
MQTSSSTYTLDEAYHRVLDRNGGLRINNGFLSQLMVLEKKVHNENSIDFFDKKARRGNKVSLVSGKRFRKNRSEENTTEEAPSEDTEINIEEDLVEAPKSPISRRRLRKVVTAIETPAEEDPLDDILNDTEPTTSTEKTEESKPVDVAPMEVSTTEPAPVESATEDPKPTEPNEAYDL